MSDPRRQVYPALLLVLCGWVCNALVIPTNLGSYFGLLSSVSLFIVQTVLLAFLVLALWAYADDEAAGRKIEK